LSSSLIKKFFFAKSIKFVFNKLKFNIKIIFKNLTKIYGGIIKKIVLGGDYDDEYVVSKWWDCRYWYNPGGWCGPNCLTFVSAVDGQYWGANVSGMVPGSEWFMKNIYRKVLEKVGEGAKAPWDLKNALEANTSFSLCWIFSIFGIWSSVRDSLKSVNIPALSLRGTGWVEQANKWDWAWHWRVVLGTRKEHREWQEKWAFLWWSWYVTKTSDTYYYHMRDNGSD